MEQLNLPTYSFKIKQDGQRKLIFDSIRKKYVVLTPEEWVRQNFVKYLNEEKDYPLSLMSLEAEQRAYTARRRTDILIFNAQGNPVMIVECKAPGIKLGDKTFEQAAGYNYNLKVNYLLVTNGLKHYCMRLDIETKRWEFLKDIPDYCDVKNW
jgi:hypothetical protein